MLKKMMLLALSVGALVAFMAPAAQANVQLTDEGEPLASGAEVTATSTNYVTTFAGGGRAECEKIVLHLTVEENGLEHVTLTQDGVVTTTNCNINVGVKFPVTVTDGTLGHEEGNELTFDTWGTATSHFHAGTDVPALGLSCIEDGTVDLLATDGTDIIHVGPSILTAMGQGCGNSTIEGSFTLETPDETPVIVDAVNT